MRALGWGLVVTLGCIGCGDGERPTSVDAGHDAALDAEVHAALDAALDANPVADASADAGSRFALRPPLGIAMNACGPDLPSDALGGEITRLGGLGADFYHLRAQWDDLESNPDFLDLIKFAPGFVKDSGYDVVQLMLVTVDTTIRTMPASVRDLALDSQATQDAFIALVIRLFGDASFASNVDYICLGNEVDAYFSSHPEELESYGRFLTMAVATLRSAGVTVPIGITVTEGSLVPTRSAAAQLALDHPDLDFVGVTYYPMEAGFQFRDPTTADDDVDAVMEGTGNAQVLWQEIGYASAAANNGSDQRQAEFIGRAIERITQHRQRVIGINVNWSCDLPMAECDRLATELYLTPPGTPGRDAFVGFLCSLGLRSPTMPITDRPAWDVFLDAVARH